MTAPFDFPALAAIARAERERRHHAWRDMLAQGKARAEQTQADELLWLEIETWARRYAGEATARACELPRSFARMAKSARTTLDRAVATISDDDVQGCRKIRDLWHLTRWLEICALWAAPLPREPELFMEKAA